MPEQVFPPVKRQGAAAYVYVFVIHDPIILFLQGKHLLNRTIFSHTSFHIYYYSIDKLAYET